MSIDPAQVDDPWSLVAFLALLTFIAWQTWRNSRHAKRTRQTLEHEVNPNSGGSLRDAVDRIEKSQADTVARVAALEAAAERRRGHLIWRR